MKAVVALSSKGQLTLPVSVRNALGLERGDRLEVSVDESRRSITISPVIDIDELSARVSGYAKRRVPVKDVDAYYQEHRNESPEL